ncbi:MAG: Diaminobutyrate--2-oxoglutarate transaminase [Firmicutes bacterium ADurb.Bin300]|nr:MAG: Diaminobutyrate--2-oxoglutarate transaminase [Firmicutes bacterium ADurb.Bin300]
MTIDIFEAYESNVRSYCRSFPAVFARAKNAELFDETGKGYIDFFCGAGALNYGHNNDYIKDKVIEYIANDGIIHSLDMYTHAKREFLEFFEKEILIARSFDYKIQFPGPTGTNAVEAALKLARKVKKRSGIFALMGAFHGMTLGALALTTDRDSREGAGVALNNVTFVPAPYMYPELDTIEYIENLLTDDHSGADIPAAIIIETVQAEGGVYVFDELFLKRLRILCDKYDILLIIDDIQVGCARTGTFFSFERAAIAPDIAVLSKSIGGYGFPLALTLIKPQYDIWSPGEHNGTFRGNQIAFVAAKAGLEYMLQNSVENQARIKGEKAKKYITDEILPLSSKLKLRGIGLILGIDMTSLGGNNISKAVMKSCFENGVIAERAGRDNAVLKIMPPLTIEEDKLLKGLEIIRDSIKANISVSKRTFELKG